MKTKSPKPLVERLAGYIEEVSDKKFEKVDRDRLAELIRYVRMDHDRRLSSEVPKHQSNLHEFEPDLTRVIELLEREANSFQLQNVLARPTTRSKSGFGAFTHQSKRYRTLLSDLRKIRGAIPTAPVKPGRGRPSYNKHLFAMADALTQIWERESGKRFSQDWHKDKLGRWKPATAAAQFVYDAVVDIDDHQTASLRKVMEAIIKIRRRSTPRK